MAITRILLRRAALFSQLKQVGIRSLCASRSFCTNPKKRLKVAATEPRTVSSFACKTSEWNCWLAAFDVNIGDEAMRSGLVVAFPKRSSIEAFERTNLTQCSCAVVHELCFCQAIRQSGVKREELWITSKVRVQSCNTPEDVLKADLSVCSRFPFLLIQWFPPPFVEPV